ncbi:porin [Falsihalocynthiibacter sp. SS001]|uniref:porin n=1 Tax=Falsihalocynthiibacter sp. SS001 TaxID=3349698 RepID=UPI0036D270A9
MKKLLIATTALVATAGAAAADISISGDGRMGLVYGPELQYDPATDTFSVENETRMSSRLRIAFSASGETDTGLAFGGSVRADNAGGGAAGTAGSVFISGAFGKLSMGDVDGAAKAAVGQVSGVGYTGIGDLNEIAYINSGTDFDDDGFADTFYPVPSALYEYSFGDTTFYAGIGQIGHQLATANVAGVPVTIEVGQSYSVGVKWAGANGLTLAGGYEITEDVNADGNDASAWAFGADWTNGTFTVKGRYHMGDWAGLGDIDQLALSADWTSGATTVTGYYRVVDFKDADAKEDAFGLGAAYDLGGGATIAGGIATIGGDLFDDRETYGDLGIKFSF